MVGGITSSFADEAQVEVGIGDLRGEILSLFCASGRRSDGNKPKLQGRCGARACGPAVADRRGLAKLQQNADFRALLRPQPDQHEERREAEGALHLRHLAINGLRDRPDHGGGRAHRHDRIRYFLDQPLNLRRELALARGISSLHPADQSSEYAYLNGMLFRGTNDGRVLAYDFKTGKRLWETRIAVRQRANTRPARSPGGLVFIGNAGGQAPGPGRHGRRSRRRRCR